MASRCSPIELNPIPDQRVEPPSRCLYVALIIAALAGGAAVGAGIAFFAASDMEFYASVISGAVVMNFALITLITLAVKNCSKSNAQPDPQAADLSPESEQEPDDASGSGEQVASETRDADAEARPKSGRRSAPKTPAASGEQVAAEASDADAGATPTSGRRSAPKTPAASGEPPAASSAGDSAAASRPAEEPAFPKLELDRALFMRALGLTNGHLVGSFVAKVFDMGAGRPSHQPENFLLPRMATIHSRLLEAFEEALRSHSVNPWSHEEVVTAADHYIHAAYVVSSLTLEDLVALKAKLEKESPGITLAAVLSHPSCYCYRTFFYLPLAYRYLHGAATMGESSFVLPKITPEAHVSQFYRQEGKPAIWHKLFNDFCARLVDSLGEEVRTLPSAFRDSASFDRDSGSFIRWVKPAE